MASPSIFSGTGSPSQSSIAGKRSTVRIGSADKGSLDHTGVCMWARTRPPWPDRCSGISNRRRKSIAFARHHEQVAGPVRAELVEQLVGCVGVFGVPGGLEPLPDRAGPRAAHRQRVSGQRLVADSARRAMEQRRAAGRSRPTPPRPIPPPRARPPVPASRAPTRSLPTPNASGRRSRSIGQRCARGSSAARRPWPSRCPPPSPPPADRAPTAPDGRGWALPGRGTSRRDRDGCGRSRAP